MAQILDTVKKVFVPSIFTGIGSIGIYYLLVDSDLGVQIPLGSMSLPAWAVVGGSATVGNMIGEVASEVITPMIAGKGSYQKYEDAILPPVLSGLGTYLVFKMFVSDQTSLVNSILIGAGGSVAGKYIYGMV